MPCTPSEAASHVLTGCGEHRIAIRSDTELVDNCYCPVNVPEDDHSDTGKTRAKHQHCSNKVAEQVIQEPAPMNILMITLWFLNVKCKLEESLKK